MANNRLVDMVIDNDKIMEWIGEDEYRGLADVIRAVEANTEQTQNCLNTLDLNELKVIGENIKYKTCDVGTERDLVSIFSGFKYPFHKSILTEQINKASVFVGFGDEIDVSVVCFVEDDGGNVLFSEEKIVNSGEIEFSFNKELITTETFYLGWRTNNFIKSIPYNTTSYEQWYLDSTEGDFGYYVTSNNPTNWAVLSNTRVYQCPIYFKYDNSLELDKNYEYFNLPDTIYGVVGKPMEIFFKGILNVVNPQQYLVEMWASQGNLYTKKYITTPTKSGTENLRFFVKTQKGRILADKTIKFVISDVKTSPITALNVLCVGDSLTVGGQWVHEFKRLLTATDGVPVGDGLTNIDFIGTQVFNGANYEGYGGWTYKSFNTAGETGIVWIDVTVGMKTVSDQHSIFVDSNGTEWKLETIDEINNKIKLIRETGTTELPLTSTLVWVSGGTDTTDIVFTFNRQEDGNPFWFSGSVNFESYATSLGVSNIDVCYVLLGWNSTNVTIEEFKSNAETFINNVRASYPKCKIKLVTLQVPSRNGFGENYGTAWLYKEKLDKIYEMKKVYEEIIEENTDLELVHLSSQFDTENNHLTGTRQLNLRNVETETYQINGVHPADSGYMQIADVVYREFINNVL